MQDQMTEKINSETVEEIISILKESDFYSELSQEEQENLIKIILSSQ